MMNPVLNISDLLMPDDAAGLTAGNGRNNPASPDNAGNDFG